MRNRWWVTTAFAVATLAVAACGSSGSGGSSGSSGGSTSSGSAPASTSSVVKTTKIGSATVLTNARGFTLYTFAIDGMNKSQCNTSCIHYWPPLKGPVTATGIKGTFTTIKRSDGTTQETWNGHPLYTYIGDSRSRAGQGQRPEPVRRGVACRCRVRPAAPAPSQSSSSSGGGGY